MKIIIAGAGDIGSHLAKLLSSESHDIYLIDNNEERLNAISSQIDVITITGDAKSVELMDQKLISTSDLLIAVTSSEETNMLICILGKKLGAKHTIARINDDNIIKENRYNEQGKFLPWILRVAHNMAIDNFRKEKRNPNQLLIFSISSTLTVLREETPNIVPNLLAAFATALSP